MTQPSEPRTKEGRALLASLASGEYRLTPEQEADYTNAILAIEAEAAAPDPVASPLNGDVLAWHDRLPHQQKGCPICEHGLIGSPDPTHNHDGGDGHCRSSCPLWTEALSRVAASADDIDPVSRPTPPVASPAPLDVERLARALVADNNNDPDLWSLLGEPSRDLARKHAERIATEYARLAEGQPVAEEAPMTPQTLAAVFSVVMDEICGCIFGYPYASEDCPHRKIAQRIAQRIRALLECQPSAPDPVGTNRRAQAEALRSALMDEAIRGGPPVEVSGRMIALVDHYLAAEGQPVAEEPEG